MPDIPRIRPAIGYAFDLHLRCGGFAYFSTVTDWKECREHGRELRELQLIGIPHFAEVLEVLGHHSILIRHESDYQHWLLKRGWAIAPVEVARSIMPHWLKARLCVKSPANTYTDVEICAEGTLKQYAGRGRRESVTKRDGGRCLHCGRSQEENRVKLTVHHVMPFSHGSETTNQNLVLLCFECNQSIGPEQVTELWQKAGIPDGIDLGLLKGENTAESVLWAASVSDSLMHTRCEIW